MHIYNDIFVLLTSVDNPYDIKIGGKHIHLLLLERGLKKLDIKVKTSYCSINKGIISLFKKGLLKLLPMYIRNNYKCNKMIEQLTYKTPNLDYDIIHAHDVLSLLAMSSKSQPKILTLHGYLARESIQHNIFKNKEEKMQSFKILLDYEKKGIGYSDHIITVDNRLKKYIISNFKYPEKKISVIYNAVDTTKFEPVSKYDQNKIKNILGYHKEDFIILTPRRLVKKNGVIYAIKAMNNIDNINIKLIIAGNGPEESTILKESIKDPRINMVGSIPHNKIDLYYKAADIILIPSITTHNIQEATSLSMLEGMSCGKVVLGSNIGGIKEIIKNTKTGVLIEEKDSKNISYNIKTLFENTKLRNNISKNSREYILDNHSYLEHSKKILNIYNEILGGKKNR